MLPVERLEHDWRPLAEKRLLSVAREISFTDIGFFLIYRNQNDCTCKHMSHDYICKCKYL